jgi:hypothetical protein
MAITTKSSISVNPSRRFFMCVIILSSGVEKNRHSKWGGRAPPVRIRTFRDRCIRAIVLSEQGNRTAKMRLQAGLVFPKQRPDAEALVS